MRATIGIAITTGALAVMCGGVASAQETPRTPAGEEIPPPSARDVPPSAAPDVAPPPTPPAVVPAPVVVQETAPSYLRTPLRAPREAFELGVGTGYTQGFGQITAGRPVGGVADAGLDLGVTLGYRSSPAVGLGLTTSYQQYKADTEQQKGTSVRGMTAGVQASFHLAPFERVDPVLSIGTGYRLLWTAPPGRDNNTLVHGLELGRVNAGLDIRVSDSVSLGPSIGGSLNYFIWENPEGPKGNRQLQDRRVNSFVFAGVQGRFDIGGRRQERIIAVGAR